MKIFITVLFFFVFATNLSISLDDIEFVSNSNLPLSNFSLRLSQKTNRRLDSENRPLFTGYGTHFVFVYVGTPPQRQSVIIDTGSHLTAFPCTGCDHCGKHTDDYWNLEKSSTAHIEKCRGEEHDYCHMEQAYSEGSSWKAFKVVDKFWVGGIKQKSVPSASGLSVDFTFGCQTSETGLFRTQKEEGIMGLSIFNDTLPAVLQQQGITRSRVFSLCLRPGGGILTLGGVDPSIHLPDPSHPISFARLVNLEQSNWFIVHLLDIKLHLRRKGDDRGHYLSVRKMILEAQNHLKSRSLSPHLRSNSDSGPSLFKDQQHNQKDRDNNDSVNNDDDGDDDTDDDDDKNVRYSHSAREFSYDLSSLNQHLLPPLSSFDFESSFNEGMGCIVDSGTTVTHLPEGFQTPLYVAIQLLTSIDIPSRIETFQKEKKSSSSSSIPTGESDVFSLSEDLLSSLPDLIFEFEGAGEGEGVMEPDERERREGNRKNNRNNKETANHHHPHHSHSHTHSRSSSPSLFKSQRSLSTSSSYSYDDSNITFTPFSDHSLPLPLSSPHNPRSVIFVRLPWTSYLQSYGQHLYSFSFEFLPDEGGMGGGGGGGGGGAILGAEFMNNRNIIFDVENERIGFVEADCGPPNEDS